ncbi:MAG: creatininase family protein [Treponema sp.]|jgi:creatinine amidohydrolase|nr:creatininase family protein [Treponema sp.]
MYLVQKMSRIQVEERIKKYPAAILPVGSCEQHGPHLPMGTDIILAETLAGMVSDVTGALVFPSLNFGYSWVWRDIAGTISLSIEHMIAVLKDAASSMERYGIRLLVFLNGHEANNASIKYAIREAQDSTSVKLLGMFYPGLKETYETWMESPTWGGVFHACEFETSLMLAACPDLVDMSLAVTEYPKSPPLFGMDNTMMGSISASGVFGDPKCATKEKGKAMMDAFVKNISEIIIEAFPPGT